MAQRSGLGKGLEALLGDVSSNKNSEMTEVQIGLLDPNREQARKDFNEERLQDLVNSIKISGIIQPLIVNKNGERYTIVAGERRFRAARIAGLKTVPVLVRNYSLQDLMEVSLIENLQREDLNAIEEASGIKLLMQQHDLTQEEVAVRLGKNRSTIANTLRLLSLPEEIIDMLRNGVISAGHAKGLLSLEDKEEQIRLAKLIDAEKLPVRQVEKIAQNKKTTRQQTAKREESELYDVEEELRNVFETKVSITGSLQRGKITIEYYSSEQLESIYEIIKKK